MRIEDTDAPLTCTQEPTGEVPSSFEGVAPEDLQALADAGIGEGDDDTPHMTEGP